MNSPRTTERSELTNTFKIYFIVSKTALLVPIRRDLQAAKAQTRPKFEKECYFCQRLRKN